jgi:hypothetical protein
VTTVACVLKSGRFEHAIYKDGYTPEDVARLRNMVADHLGEHRFVCFSDVEVPCERIPLKHGWPGWWSKVELFREPFDDLVVYFDLDTVIAGPLEELAAFDHQFTMLRDFGRWDIPNSGFMAWRGDYSHLYRTFAADADRQMREYVRPPRLGDQAFISEHQAPAHLWQDLFPQMIFSYKLHLREKPRPADARVVCFHGEPKGAGSTGWVHDIWSKAHGSR